MSNAYSNGLVNGADWEKILKKLPGSHFLQSKLWANIKKDNGWSPNYLVWKDEFGNIVAGAMILERKINLLKIISLIINYCPKGPLLNWEDKKLVDCVLFDIEEFSRQRKAIFLKIDPDVFVCAETSNQIEEKIKIDQNNDHVMEILIGRNWIESREQIQFRNSIYLSLAQSNEELLKNMKQKTRYNIRLSERKGVTVRVGESKDFENLYHLYVETALRDKFVIREKPYYLNVWNKFYKSGYCEPIIAEYDEKILAAVIIYYFGSKAYYVYGMSSEENRNLMATYLLQWKAIQRAKERGCSIYDLWGAPDEISESDKMWGVYKFKLGFGGELIKTIGAWDFRNKNFTYYLYQKVLPKILDLMRRIGFLRLKNEV